MGRRNCGKRTAPAGRIEAAVRDMVGADGIADSAAPNSSLLAAMVGRAGSKALKWVIAVREKS